MPMRGILDLLDDAIRGVSDAKRQLMETTDPAVVRRWRIQLQNAESTLIEARRRLERADQLTKH